MESYNLISSFMDTVRLGHKLSLPLNFYFARQSKSRGNVFGKEKQHDSFAKIALSKTAVICRST